MAPDTVAGLPQEAAISEGFLRKHGRRVTAAVDAIYSWLPRYPWSVLALRSDAMIRAVSDAPHDRDRVRPQDVDIGALLGVALGPPPPAEFADSVGAKVTLMTTLAEVTLLLFAAPLSWLRDDATPESDRDLS